MTTIGKQISTLRRRKGWSMDELARRCDVSKPTILHAEHDSGVQIRKLVAILDALGYRIEIVAKAD